MIWTDVWYETLLLWVSSLKSIRSDPKIAHLQKLYEASLAEALFMIRLLLLIQSLLKMDRAKSHIFLSETPLQRRPRPFSGHIVRMKSQRNGAKSHERSSRAM